MRARAALAAVACLLGFLAAYLCISIRGNMQGNRLGSIGGKNEMAIEVMAECPSIFVFEGVLICNDAFDMQGPWAILQFRPGLERHFIKLDHNIADIFGIEDTKIVIYTSNPFPRVRVHILSNVLVGRHTHVGSWGVSKVFQTNMDHWF